MRVRRRRLGESGLDQPPRDREHVFADNDAASTEALIITETEATLTTVQDLVLQAYFAQDFKRKRVIEVEARPSSAHDDFRCVASVPPFDPINPDPPRRPVGSVRW
jgi:hypothetical protein